VVYLDDQATSLDDLKRQLHAQAAQALAADPGELPEVQLRADERVPYGKVVEVMGVAQQAGMNRIGFVTERKQPPARP
jgi:biopolymer transport protein TolR